MATLDSLLVPGAVELHGAAKDWRAAIRLAGSLLEEAGTITADYTNAMVHSVEETGPYIVVAPGFAFAHARPSEAVKETSLSWVRLDKPVEFGHDSNDPVDLVVAFAARNDSEHLQAMKQLAKLEEVMHVVHLEEDSSCCSELVFVKLHTPDVSVRSDIRQLCDLYGARVVDTQESEIIIELSEVPSRIDAFLDVISNFKILEMSRSGVTAIEK